jgi:hypothetical protein
MQLETENTETEVTTFSSRIATLCWSWTGKGRWVVRYW